MFDTNVRQFLGISGISLIFFLDLDCEFIKKHRSKEPISLPRCWKYSDRNFRRGSFRKAKFEEPEFTGVNEDSENKPDVKITF